MPGRPLASPPCLPPPPQNLERELSSHEALAQAVVDAGRRLVEAGAGRAVAARAQQLEDAVGCLRAEAAQRRRRLQQAQEAQQFLTEVRGRGARRTGPSSVALPQLSRQGARPLPPKPVVVNHHVPDDLELSGNADTPFPGQARPGRSPWGGEPGTGSEKAPRGGPELGHGGKPCGPHSEPGALEASSQGRLSPLPRSSWRPSPGCSNRAVRCTPRMGPRVLRPRAPPCGGWRPPGDS